MLIISHRGVTTTATENTIQALRAAVAEDVDMLEFDVRLTKDKIPVVIHDATTKRTHGTLAVISRCTLAELRDLELSPALPTLAEVLDEFFGRIVLNIELKSRGSGKVVTTLLRKKYAKTKAGWDTVLLSSFKAAELIGARRASKHVPLALLHSQNPFVFIAYHRWLRLSAVGFHRLYINPLALEIAKRVGLFCYAYTVDREHGAILLAQKGLDGVVTNKPHLLISALQRQSDST